MRSAGLTTGLPFCVVVFAGPGRSSFRRWSPRTSSRRPPQAARASPAAASARIETMRLRLDIEYDGTDFHGVGRAARIPDGRGPLCDEALGEPVRRSTTTSQSRGGPTRAFTLWARSRASTSRAARRPENAAEALNTTLPDDIARARGGAGGRGSSTPGSGPGALSTATGSGAARRLRPSSSAAAGGPGADRPVEARGCGRPIIGRHDFRAFTPTETQHVVFKREVRERRVAPARRRARARAHRGQLPAPHGAHARRDDARAGAEARSRSWSRGARAPRRGRPRPRGACTSCRSSTEIHLGPALIRRAATALGSRRTRGRFGSGR